MKVIHKLDVPVDSLEDIFCNKCGNSLKSPQGSYYGLVEAVVTGGYESLHLEDGDVHKFSLCEACCKTLFAEMTYSTLQGNFLFEETPRATDFNPEEFFLGDKLVPPMSPEEFAEFEKAAAELRKEYDKDKSLIENIDSLKYETLDGFFEDDDELVELMSPLPPRKKEDLN